MRVKLLVGLMAIAAGAPLCAQADHLATVKESDLIKNFDIRDSGRVSALPDLEGMGTARGAAIPFAMDAQSEPLDAVIRAPRTIRAVDTETPRRFAAPIAHVVTTTGPATTPTAAPEMSSGLAATGLTLLLGGIAVLRSRRTRFNA